MDVRVLTSPTPWSIDNDVAFDADQDSVADPPVTIPAGLAVNEEMTGGLVMITLAVAVTDPLLFAAVNV